MKNIHLIPTDKPSRLHLGNSGLVLCDFKFGKNTINGQNIYITNDEEIKEGDYMFDVSEMTVYECIGQGVSGYKIILTTDQDLDGVQPIDDEFLEWFVRNPSCEEVEVGYGWIRLAETDNEGYWVSIPDKQFEMQQEEPKQDLRKYPLTPDECFKQETLEEVAKSEAFEFSVDYKPWETDLDYREYAEYGFEKGFIEGTKYQAKGMYSEKQLFKILLDFVEFPHDHNEGRGSIINRFLKELKKK